MTIPSFIPDKSDESALRHFFFNRFSTFESLQFRDFRWHWLGSFFAFMAMNMLMITRGWLILKMTDDSPLALAMVMMSFALPLSVGALIGGVLADRIPRKSMIAFTQSGNALLTLLLAILDDTGLIRYWHLLAIGFFNGTMVAFNFPSRQAIISDLVPEESVMNGVALNNSGLNLGRVGGPAIAGVLIIYMGTAGVFYLITGIWAFAALSTLMIRSAEKPSSSSKKSLAGDIRDGFSYALHNPILLGLVIMTFIPSLFGFSYFALLPVWAREALNVHSDGLGMLLMVMGMGSLVGTLILASMDRFRRRGALLLVNSILWGASLTLFSQATSYAFALPFLFLTGLLSAVYMSLNMTLMQIYAEPEMRGRIISLGIMTFGMMPLSALPFGAIAENIGTPNALSLSGVLLVVFTVIFTFVYPRFRKIA
ncbi:MFS transporter [Thermodesulfobacteriota bacterium]